MVSILEHPMLLPESRLPDCYLLGPWFEETKVKKLAGVVRADDFGARDDGPESWKSEVASSFLFPFSFLSADVPPGVMLRRLFAADSLSHIGPTLRDHSLFEEESSTTAMTLILSLGGEVVPTWVSESVRIHFGWKPDGRGNIRVSVRGSPTIDAALNLGLFEVMELDKEPLTKAIENVNLWQYGECSLGQACISRHADELTVQVARVEPENVRSMRECLVQMFERIGRDPVLANAGVFRITDQSEYVRADTFLDAIGCSQFRIVISTTVDTLGSGEVDGLSVVPYARWHHGLGPEGYAGQSTLAKLYRPGAETQALLFADCADAKGFAAAVAKGLGYSEEPLEVTRLE